MRDGQLMMKYIINLGDQGVQHQTIGADATNIIAIIGVNNYQQIINHRAVERPRSSCLGINHESKEIEI